MLTVGDLKEALKNIPDNAQVKMFVDTNGYYGIEEFEVDGCGFETMTLTFWLESQTLGDYLL
jgi:hypothetical protein